MLNTPIAVRPPQPLRGLPDQPIARALVASVLAAVRAVASAGPGPAGSAVSAGERFLDSLAAPGAEHSQAHWRAQAGLGWKIPVR